MRSSNSISDTQHGNKESPKTIESKLGTSPDNIINIAPTEPLVVLFSEKGRCHFCRLLCPNVKVNIINYTILDSEQKNIRYPYHSNIISSFNFVIPGT